LRADHSPEGGAEQRRQRDREALEDFAVTSAAGWVCFFAERDVRPGRASPAVEVP